MCLPTYYSMYFPMRRHLCNLMAETGGLCKMKKT